MIGFAEFKLTEERVVLIKISDINAIEQCENGTKIFVVSESNPAHVIENIDEVKEKLSDVILWT